MQPFDKYSGKWAASTAHVGFIRVAGHPLVTRRIPHVDPLLSAQRSGSRARISAYRAPAGSTRFSISIGLHSQAPPPSPSRLAACRRRQG
jgi:hypothetical protein